MTLPTATSDLALVYGLTPDGQLSVDVALTPGGDVATVAGPARLVQDIRRWMLSPQGSDPFNPTWGNPLFGLLLRPGSNDPAVYQEMVEQAEASFIADQAQAAAQGFLSTDEQVDHFTPAQVTIGDGTPQNGPVGSVFVLATVVTRAGTSAPLTVSFGATIGS